jgi:hypothetical protein
VVAEARRRTGVLLVAMHCASTWHPGAGPDDDGDADPDAGEIVETEAFGHPVELRVTLVNTAELSQLARAAGLPPGGWRERAPYPGEYPTRRVYLWSGPHQPQHVSPESWLPRPAGPG